MISKFKGNTFIAGSAIYLISNVLNAVIPFILLPVLTRHLSVEEYGQVAMYQTFFGVVTAFIGLSLHGAAGRKFYDGDLAEGELAEFIGSCFQILLLTTLISTIIVLISDAHFSKWLGLDPSWIFLAVLTASATITAQVRLGQWQVRKKAISYGVLQVTRSALNISLSLILVLVFLKGADGRIFAQVIVATSFGAISFWLLKRDHLLKFFVWRPNHIQEALKFGVPLIPHVSGVILLTMVDRIVINAELGLAEAGIYMVAVQFKMALSLVFDSVNKAYVPWLFERLKLNGKSDKKKIVRYTYYWFVFLLFGSVLSFLIGPWLVTFVAGEEYKRAGDVIGWLIVGEVFNGMSIMMANYIFFSKRTGFMALISVSSGLINVALLIIFVENMGIIGAAYAFSISMVLLFFLCCYLANKRHPMPWFSL